MTTQASTNPPAASAAPASATPIAAAPSAAPASPLPIGEPTSSEDAAQFHLGFQRLERAIRAVPDREFLTMNLDVPSSVATVLGALREINTLRDTIVQLPAFDVARFDTLQDAALALGHAHARYRIEVENKDDVSELVAEAVQLRDTLHADATALIKRGVIDARHTLKLRGGNAHKNIAFDVLSLVEVFLDFLPRLVGKTAVTQAELEHARFVANRIVALAGQREQAVELAGPAARLRQQAFTLFIQTYDDARRAVEFIRWHEGDAERIAPSLYAGRGRRPSPTATDEAVPSVPETEAPPEPTSALPAVATHGDIPAGLSSPFAS
jgi:hypothetical protein